MRGGVTMEDLLHIYSTEDVEIMAKIVQENIELSQKSGMNLV
jgi:hypothetical protein